jgi:hypothetical protein
MNDRRTIDAGAPEIEVTPEMIKAAMAVYYRHDPRSYDIDEILPDIFRAMIAAKKAA